MELTVASLLKNPHRMRLIKWIRFGIPFLCGLLALSCHSQNEVVNIYSNPVIPGEFPDPSIIRVGETYYSAGTSFDFAPNYPIYQSDDLVNWKRIASVFSVPPAWSSDDFWAPELFYKDGIFYVYYTTKRKDTRIACIGVATTRDISKGFSDHGIIIEWGEEAIDAFVFQDEEGKLYITWKAYGLTPGRDVEILASPLSEDGLKLAGDYFCLTDRARGWEGEAGEGQCLVKHNQYYYLFYSVGGCCDNQCDYRVMVARTKDLHAKWEQFPGPILQGGEVWRCTGHGTLVTTPDDRYFYLYHAYNLTDFEHIGRQGLLDEVFWDKESGWPYFINGTPSESAITPLKNTVQTRDSIWIDDFSSDKNLAFWEWDLNHPKPSYEVSGGEMRIGPSSEGIAFLGLRPQSGAYSLAAEIIPADVWSGIGSYCNEENLLTLMVKQSEILLMQANKGERKILSTEDIGELGSVCLKYEAVSGRYFQFFWSENGEDWIPVPAGGEYTVDGTFIAQWGYSPRAGFIMEGEEGGTHSFTELRIEYSY
jgi:beta-xylosidase